MSEATGVTPEKVLRTYFRAKDENRPYLLVDVFAEDVRLEINNRSAQISFPGVTLAREAIADVLVRHFNATYESIYSLYLDRPGLPADTFACDWLVDMTEKASKRVRVGCDHYEWAFESEPALLAAKLKITVEQMIVLPPDYTMYVMRSLRKLDYPWSSAAQVTRALVMKELRFVSGYIGRMMGR